MNKNKRLLYMLGNIPEKYIDEAMSEQARKMKIQWKYIVTAAACFVVIAALPVHMLYKSYNQQHHGIGSHTEVSQITSTINSETAPDQSDPASDSEPEVNTPCRFPGTGPEKPADYKPDMIGCKIEKGFDLQDGYFVITFLKDKEFQERINSDIRQAADSLAPYFDQTYIENSTYAADANLYEILKNTNGVDYYPSFKNGYLSITVSYVSEMNVSSAGGSITTHRNFDHVVTLNYDLIEQKKIENLSDLFYKGEDVLSLINTSVKSDIDNQNYLTDPLIVKSNNFNGFTQIPESFTIDSVILSQGNPYFDIAPQLFFDSNSNDMLMDHMITGKYRDVKEIVDDNCGVYDFSTSQEWNSSITSDNTQNNLTIYYNEITGSRFHTQEEISEYKQKHLKLQQTAVNYYMENYKVEDQPDIFKKTDSGYEIYACNFFMIEPNDYLKDVYTVIGGDGHTINIDSKTYKILLLSDICNDPDVSKVTDQINWKTTDINNNILSFCVETESPDEKKLRIYMGWNIESINKDYFNPDYEQQKQNREYY